jgi:hypothetical protein
MKLRQWIIVAVVVIAAIVLAVTNPSEDDHMDAIRGRQDSAVGAGLAIAADALGAYEYHNYFLFSTVTSGEDRVSLGVLDNVWTSEE